MSSWFKVLSGFSLIHAQIFSPTLSSGTPITCTSSTSGCVLRRFSISSGDTFTAMWAITSLMRPRNVIRPSSLIVASSPVWYQLSRMASFVLASSLRYPLKTCGPRVHNSPFVFTGTILPWASTTFTST
uniref:Putative secreted protein n=1 Tax=Ixodes ricinus TaxID=34613 RepID=A0A6B0UR50_IXORI